MTRWTNWMGAGALIVLASGLLVTVLSVINDANFGLIALLAVVLLAASALLLIRGEGRWFAVTTGGLLLLEPTLIVLASTLPPLVSWGVFGMDLAALLIGMQYCDYKAMLELSGAEMPGSESFFILGLGKGLLRVVAMVTAVMVVSLIILVLSLNASLGALPLTLAGVCALLALVSLTVLALARRTG